MRVAIIDLGTNTFNLFIAETKNNRFQELHKSKIAVRLGDGGINNKTITPDAFKRGISAIKTHLTTIKSFAIENIYAFGTSAIRDAKNGKEFANTIKKAANIDVSIISGDREAELIYHGVKQAVSFNNRPFLIIDIGGGSTEFIIANKSTIFWKKSYQLGIARLLEKFQPSDPITKQEIDIIESYLLAEMVDLSEQVKLYQPYTLIGSSGSFDSFVDMLNYTNAIPHLSASIKTYDFNLPQLTILHQNLLQSTLQERLKMNGLIPMRADMIVLASILSNLVIKAFVIKALKLSTYSLKEGVLWELMNNNPSSLTI